MSIIIIIIVLETLSSIVFGFWVEFVYILLTDAEEKLKYAFDQGPWSLCNREWFEAWCTYPLSERNDIQSIARH